MNSNVDIRFDINISTRYLPSDHPIKTHKKPRKTHKIPMWHLKTHKKWRITTRFRWPRHQSRHSLVVKSARPGYLLSKTGQTEVSWTKLRGFPRAPWAMAIAECHVIDMYNYIYIYASKPPKHRTVILPLSYRLCSGYIVDYSIVVSFWGLQSCGQDANCLPGSTGIDITDQNHKGMASKP